MQERISRIWKIRAKNFGRWGRLTLKKHRKCNLAICALYFCCEWKSWFFTLNISSAEVFYMLCEFIFHNDMWNFQKNCFSNNHPIARGTRFFDFWLCSDFTLKNIVVRILLQRETKLYMYSEPQWYFVEVYRKKISRVMNDRTRVVFFCPPCNIYIL